MAAKNVSSPVLISPIGKVNGLARHAKWSRGLIHLSFRLALQCINLTPHEVTATSSM